MAVVGVVLLGIVIALANRSTPPEPTSPVATANTPNYDKPVESVNDTSAKLSVSDSVAKTTPELILPPLQTTFTSVVQSFIPAYNAADTEIRKTNIRFERKDAIARYFSASGNLQFQYWVGQVEGLRTESDGEAAISVKLRGAEILIKTWSNSFSDHSSHTMISRNDSLYPSLMAIKEGTPVTVSGTFVRDDGGQDYVSESSVTEAGSMTNPEFIVRFSKITAGQPLAEQEQLPN
jgi:hypothetical protein